MCPAMRSLAWRTRTETGPGHGPTALRNVSERWSKSPSFRVSASPGSSPVTHRRPLFGLLKYLAISLSVTYNKTRSALAGVKTAKRAMSWTNIPADCKLGSGAPEEFALWYFT